MVEIGNTPVINKPVSNIQNSTGIEKKNIAESIKKEPADIVDVRVLAQSVSEDVRRAEEKTSQIQRETQPIVEQKAVIVELSKAAIAVLESTKTTQQEIPLEQRIIPADGDTATAAFGNTVDVKA